MSRINTFSWHRIQIKTLFTAVNTGNILSRDVEDGSGYTPYVTSSAFNNGVAAHIDVSMILLQVIVYWWVVRLLH